MSRVAPESSLVNDARMLASRIRRAERRIAEATEEYDEALEELTAIHRRTCERFGRADIPTDALVLDVLEQIDIQVGDVWRWRGMTNNKGLPTLRTRSDDRRELEKSVVRFLAVAFGVIDDDAEGMLFPLPGFDQDDVNPWHRTMRVTATTPTGNRWRFQPKPDVS